jgi:hypothetical protein
MNKEAEFEGLRVYGLLTNLTRFAFYSYDPTSDTFADIALSSAPEVTSSYVTTWVRVGVNRARALYDTVVSSVFHTLLSCSIEFWTMHSASFS